MKTVSIALPSDIFEQGARAERAKPLKMKKVRQLARLQQEMQTNIGAFDELCVELATVWPEWNLVDLETGQPLPQPKDDAAVFDELEPAAFRYFGGAGLSADPFVTRRNK